VLQAPGFVKRIVDLADAGDVDTASQMAWLLLSKCTAHALDFDSKLLPATDINFIAEPFAEVVSVVALHGLTGDHARNADAEARIALPGALGGMGLRRAARHAHADAMFWATWVSNRDAVEQLAERQCRSIKACSREPDARLAQSRLAEAGVLVDDRGGVHVIPGALDVYLLGSGLGSGDHARFDRRACRFSWHSDLREQATKTGEPCPWAS